MPHRIRITVLQKFFLHALIMAGSLLLASAILHGVTLDTLGGLVKASCIFGLLNTSLYAFIFKKTPEPFAEKTGWPLFLTNTLLIYFTSKLLPSFYLESFSAALWDSAFISLLCYLMTHLTDKESTFRKKNRHLIKQAKARVVKSKRNQN